MYPQSVASEYWPFFPAVRAVDYSASFVVVAAAVATTGIAAVVAVEAVAANS